MPKKLFFSARFRLDGALNYIHLQGLFKEKKMQEFYFLPFRNFFEASAYRVSKLV